MATTTNGIATEGEAKSKIGSTASVTTDKAITKSRVLAIGGTIASGVSYADNLCIKYSDIVAYVPPTPTLYDWYTHTNLAWEGETIESENPPAIPARLDAFDAGWQGYDAIYTQWNPFELGKYYECVVYDLNDPAIFTRLPYFIKSNVGIPLAGAYDGDGEWKLIAISGCSPMTSLRSTSFPTIHSSCINNGLRPDYSNGTSAVLNEFPNANNLGNEILGAIGAYGANYSLLINELHADVDATLKFGLEFYMLFHNKLFGKPFKLMYFSLYIYSLDHFYQLAPAIILYSHALQISVANADKDIQYIGVDSGLLAVIVDRDPQALENPLFEVEFMLNADGDNLLVKFTRIGNTYYNKTDILFTPYIMNVSFSLSKENPDSNLPINFYYNYDDAILAGWTNIYNSILLSSRTVIGLDALAMYQIRFLTGYSDDIYPREFVAPSTEDMRIAPFTEITIAQDRYAMGPFIPDFCIPNSPNKFQTEIVVGALKLDPASSLYAADFAISYLRSPVFFNIGSHDPSELLYPLSNYGDHSTDFSMFLYETYISCSSGNLFDLTASNNLVHYISSALNNIKFDMFDLARLVPNIVFYDPATEHDYRSGFIRFLWDNLYCNHDITDNNFGYFYELFTIFGDGWFGMPEFFFFTPGSGCPDGNDLGYPYKNRVTVINRPRAINIVIPLDTFGDMYNRFYLGEGLCLNEIYIYYKTYFYHYGFV